MPKILDLTTSVNTDHQLKPSHNTVLKTAAMHFQKRLNT